MKYQLAENIIVDVISQHEELLELIKTLCKIPAPLNGEQNRAEFCKNWFIENGAEDVYIDDVHNVILPINCRGNNNLNIFMAHTDTVFPDVEPMVAKEENGRLYCPGVGDDTANLAILMMIARYVLKNNLIPDTGCIFVCNSGEEGLGNLKGAKAVMNRYKGKVKELISFDGTSKGCCNHAVGSIRYRVEIKTEGGHSYANFGNKNAIYYLSSLINHLYTVEIPRNGKTTLNVGEITGGTSVNTIAQQAEMLFEFRSDTKEHLESMMIFFDEAVKAYRDMGLEVNVEILGLRPCMGDVDIYAQKKIEEKVAAIFKKYTGEKPSFRPGSTDCNISFSMGIPGCSVGGFIGAGAHTRQEWIDIESLKNGSLALTAMVLDHFRRNNPEIFCD